MKNTRKLFLLGCIALQWSQVFAQQDKSNTAAPNVTLSTKEFVLDKLNHVGHKVWVYLPPNYFDAKQRFPVIYMHDGQNLFNERTASHTEWGVDEILNELFERTGKGYIVVGIANGGDERTNEYTPWKKRKDVEIPEFPDGGGGGVYMEFVVHTIKPYIDANYRTKKGRKNTGLIGSSLGGLISFYGALEYPHVFGKIGALSPSFWFSNEVWEHAKAKGDLQYTRMYLLIGGKEPEFMVSDTKKMYNLLLSIGFEPDNLIHKLNPEGEHVEDFWREEFLGVMEWLFNN